MWRWIVAGLLAGASAAGCIRNQKTDTGWGSPPATDTSPPVATPNPSPNPDQ